MSFLFECPHCHARSEVEDRFAGEEGPCFSCGKTVQLPVMDSEPYLAAAQLLQQRRRRDVRSVAGAAAITVALLLTAGLVWVLIARVILPQISGRSPAAQREGSRQHLEQIAAALLQYHGDYGSFPPAYVPDSQGRPAHSWRLLLLPYLGENSLYEQYDFTQPWDSQANQRLADQMPDIFAAPGDSHAAAFGETSYVVIVGPQTLFPGAQSRSLSDLQDPAASTLMLAEVHESTIPWLAPDDLEATAMPLVVNPPGQLGISSGHSAGAWIATADGLTRWLDETAPTDVLRATLTIAGGEQVDISRDLPAER